MPKNKMVPRRRMSQIERTALSDKKMYDAAIELLLEGGTHRTTLTAVGQRAGYSRGLASSRFGSKDALFSHLVHHFNKKWGVYLAQRVGQRTGLAAFLAATEATESFIIGESKETRAIETRAMYILWYESIVSHDEVRALHADHHKILRRDTAHWIKQGIDEGTVRPTVDPERFGVQYCSFMFGIVYQWLVSPESMDLRKGFATYREAVIELVS